MRICKSFSALQRAEIAEIARPHSANQRLSVISVLFNEPKLLKSSGCAGTKLNRPNFSALQRAEIAEIQRQSDFARRNARISVLFNEPKLLKSRMRSAARTSKRNFSALQRAEIAEIVARAAVDQRRCAFQCSSTSRNC